MPHVTERGLDSIATYCSIPLAPRRTRGTFHRGRSCYTDPISICHLRFPHAVESPFSHLLPWVTQNLARIVVSKCREYNPFELVLESLLCNRSREIVKGPAGGLSRELSSDFEYSATCFEPRATCINGLFHLLDLSDVVGHPDLGYARREICSGIFRCCLS